PDTTERFDGALLRLAAYYPTTLDEVAPRLLARPRFDIDAVKSFRVELYDERDPARRRALFGRFRREQRAPEQVMLKDELFDALSRPENDEQAHRASPLGTQPRELLIELYGYPAAVRSSDRPKVAYVSDLELGWLAILLRHDRRASVDRAVLRL